MKSQETEDTSFTRAGDELSLSGSALLEILMAVLAKGASFRFQAKGSSMWPFMKNGDVITVSPLSRTSPSLGDVVVFVRPDTGNPVVHRVVGRRGDLLLMKGDNSPAPDGLFPSRDVVGRVTRVERDGKSFSGGLGPERYLLTIISWTGILLARLPPVWSFLRFVKRRLKT